MASTTTTVNMIALIIAGLAIAAWGVIYIWFNRNDNMFVAELSRQGKLTAVEVARFTNPTWIWVMAIIQIIIGVALFIWGIVQYFAAKRIDEQGEKLLAMAKARMMRSGSAAPMMADIAGAQSNYRTGSRYNFL